MKEVLIVTQKSDPHTDAVIAELKKMKCHVFRLNSESLLDFYLLNLGYDEKYNFYGFLSDKLNRKVNLKQLVAAYYRKPITVSPHRELEIDGAKDFSSLEGSIALKFLYTFPNLKWINNPFNNKQAQIKFGQLNTASKFGLRIPRTLVTNDPKKAALFFKEMKNQVLCKSLQTNSVQVNQIPVHTFSHKLTKEEQENYLDNIRYTPTLIQEYIEKKTELRVNVIGNKVFATEIYSQSLDATKHDWRKANPWTIQHSPFQLPKRLEQSLIKFVHSYNLYFSAIDLIRTPQNEFVFIENNPNGQWYWIELQTKQPLAKSIAKLLLS
ncbi:MAG: hypothetical protein WC223_13400 [Bacteroidales bacterium]|jgi:glutathione synthase/RimK-type ligase-like ATP-grasp enzyme